MIVLGIDPGPETHGAVLYDSELRRVLWSSKAVTSYNLIEWLILERMKPDAIVIERPAAMGALGVGIVGHMLSTAWAAGALWGQLWQVWKREPHTMHTRRMMEYRAVSREPSVGSASPALRLRLWLDTLGRRAVGTH